MFIAQLSTGQDVSVEFQVVNPMDFAEFISIVTKDNIDRNVDYGEVKLTAQCQSPCRSCNVATDSSSCTSCYNFSIYKTLSGTQCLNSCIDGQYQVTQSFMFYCLSCPSSCSKCTSNTTCQQCKPTYIYFNYTCLSNCPGGYFLSTDIVTGLQQCIGCSSPCK